jgi:hypothetical protein
MRSGLNQHLWDLFPHFVLRRAGFPFHLVDRLSMSKSSESLCALVDIEARLDTLVSAWNKTVFPVLLSSCKSGADKALKRSLDRTAEAIRRRRLPWREDWDAVHRLAVADNLATPLDDFSMAVDDHGAAKECFQHLFAGDLATGRQNLYAAARTTEFREALDQLNTDLQLDVTEWDVANPRNARARQQEQVLFKYLQRLCTKNETNSFFGPVHYGRIKANTSGDVLSMKSDWSKHGVSRKVFFSHWLVDDMAQKIANDPRLADIVPLAHVPSRRRRNDQGWSGLSTRDIARHFAISLLEARERVAATIAGGGWQRSLAVSPSEIHQLDALAAQVRALGAESADEHAARGEWVAQLDCLLSEGRSLAQDIALDIKKALRHEIEQRYERLTDGVARRNAGRMFRTRRVVYEDGWVDAGVKLAAREAEELKEALAPILDTGLAYAQLIAARLRAEAGGVVRTWFGADTRTLPYDRFIVAWHQQCERPRPLDAVTSDRISRLDQAIAKFDVIWSRTLDGSDDSAATSWPVERFAACVDALDLPPDCDDSLAIVSPDILPLRRNRANGEAHWVLGEVHHGATMDGWMISFHPAAAQVAGQLRDAIGAGTATADAPLRANLIMSRQMKTAPQEYPGLRVEWSAQAAPHSTEPTLGVRDLIVRMNGNAHDIDLIEPESGGRVRFYPPAFGFDQRAFAPFGMFSLPIFKLPKRAAGRFLPRRSYRNLVIARAEWWFEPEELRCIAEASDLAAAMIAAHRLRTASGVTRHTFLRCESEPKPLYVDWLNPFAVEWLQKLARSGDRLGFSEMLPGPDQLWLGGETGRYTSELRFAMMGHA